jgi:hypothetical protein
MVLEKVKAGNFLNRANSQKFNMQTPIGLRLGVVWSIHKPLAYITNALPEKAGFILRMMTKKTWKI